ncbi:maltodextrin phosphorylase [Thermococcus thioreducens]|uniref:glycogen phosphorylase n=1 Tax=Thermococcus thioreducens TaxID=277988 RepID=A0A0Q2M3V4_9EURY|nr:maltodextrin phosphorylase [Thermococcus thioreducens]ASJ12016.1 alpha-glucan phosphorylase [Thermococcus thioreducens]KQH82761.1 alpha-glucan phosphorylase [Thermococcus thioreducens]SEW09965.1 maltodextrin phosphorylase [Thermococcus thioreducens]
MVEVFNTQDVIREKLPHPLKDLAELAYNYWWSWNRRATKLWEYIDPELWQEHKNPVKLLLDVPQSRLRELLKDDDFMNLYDLVTEQFEDYMNPSSTWFSTNYPKWDKPIVYLCMEYGISRSLPIYSGGLGILAGDHVKTASDLGLPFIAIGLLYKHGYFRQEIDRDGRQREVFPEYKPEEMPIKPVLGKDGKPLLIGVPIEDRIVYARAFEVAVGRVKIYLLDTDVPENSADDRTICDYLYNAEIDKRIKQEILLGIGGMRLLRALGIEPGVVHLNEGHPAFANLQRMAWYMEEGLTFTEALSIVRGTTVFTTHTPVPAGHDRFPIEEVRKRLAKFLEGREELLELGREGDQLNMTLLAIRTSSYVNGVSQLHAEVSKRMWRDLWPDVPIDEIPIEGITNGIHTMTWVHNEMRKLFDRYLGKIWREHTNLEGLWYAVEMIPDEELWEAHLEAKRQFIEFLRRKVMRRNERLGTDDPLPDIDENALIIGFARRFATYKRATLLLTDLERLKRILNNPERPVYLVFGGKAHPMDEAGKEFLKRVYEVSQMPEFRGKIFVLENYDMGSARLMVAGVDVWLNTPRRPMEASGTSGMKAGLNGVLNASIYDGWWVEGYNGKNGWVVGEETTEPETEADDVKDAQALYDLLEREIIPTYYENREKWIYMMKESIKSIAPRFSTHRMVKEYVGRFYAKAMSNHIWLTRENYRGTKEIAAWKDRVTASWDKVVVENIKIRDDRSGFEVTLYLDGLAPEDVRVELYYGVRAEGYHVEKPYIIELRHPKKLEDGRWLYTYEGTALRHLGDPCWHYALRVYPHHEKLPHRFLLGLVKWKGLT